MKKNIHPDYNKLIVKCSCGAYMEVFSTLSNKNLKLEVCGKCHPFYTGKQKIIDRGGRIELFNKRFNLPK